MFDESTLPIPDPGWLFDPFARSELLAQELAMGRYEATVYREMGETELADGIEEAAAWCEALAIASAFGLRPPEMN